MKKMIKRAVQIILTLFIVFIAISFFILNYSKEMPEEGVIFEVERGQRLVDIADGLVENEIIRSKYLFLGYSRITGRAGGMQAGSYRLDSEMSIIDVINKFYDGDTFYETVTLIEGWTLLQMAEHLEEREIVSREEFLKITGISKPQADLIGVSVISIGIEDDYRILSDLPEGSSLEGYLFPDTYRVNPDNPEDMIRRMVLNLERRLSEGIMEEIEDSGRSVHEIITMASILEREVRTLEDKKMVADILWRRMRAGIPLQIDATVNYITGRRGIDVPIAETRINSPYNTYARNGLPEGPISNPGIASIEAAVRPIENDFWYYLSDPETGDTVFSRNHVEHVEAKNKYLR